MKNETLTNMVMATTNWPALKYLNIVANQFGDEGLAALVASPLSNNLKVLCLITDEDFCFAIDINHFIQEISKGTWKNLKQLKFGSGDFGPKLQDSIAPLAAMKFPCLTSLEVFCGVTDSLDSLVDAEWLPRLKMLHFSSLDNPADAAHWPGFLNFFRHGKFDNMEDLDLGLDEPHFSGEQVLEIAFVAHGKMPNIKKFTFPYGNGGALKASLRGRFQPEDFEREFGKWIR